MKEITVFTQSSQMGTVESRTVVSITVVTSSFLIPKPEPYKPETAGELKAYDPPRYKLIKGPDNSMATNVIPPNYQEGWQQSLVNRDLPEVTEIQILEEID
ncbi:uncharacterized protein [Clytia hemisphaerica]|uniref:Uncharacterized protein n=1 Tax=Clytia hemisphaerica TaxID=252671 RepID=A0A7M5V6W5_9CNID